MRSFVMKKTLTIGVGAALAATLLVAGTGSHAVEAEQVAAALPSGEFLAGLRQMGLNPIGEPVRRGPYYVMHAYDPRGIEMRVLADAHFGDILSVLPARPLNTVFAPEYVRAPRIIHVPPRGDDDHAKSGASETPSAPRRTVLSAPPPPATALTPVQPAPRSVTPADSNGKFAPPPSKDSP